MAYSFHNRFTIFDERLNIDALCPRLANSFPRAADATFKGRSVTVTMERCGWTGPAGTGGYDVAGGGRSGGMTGETGSSLRLSGFSRKTSGYLSGLVFCSGSVDRQT